MVEAVEVFSSGWIAHFKLPGYRLLYYRTMDSDSYDSPDSPDLPEPDDSLYLPKTHESLEDQKAVHRWIGISWVFVRPVEFKEMTALMARGCYADWESTLFLTHHMRT